MHVDGDGGLVQVVASFAVEEALVRAERLAAVSCAIRDSGRLSALGPYVLRAAERGFMALLCQKTPPIMALPMQHYLQPAGAQARYLGQRQAECERLRTETGIPIPDSLLPELRRAGDAAGQPFILSSP